METIERGDKLLPEMDSTGEIIFKKAPADHDGPYYVAVDPGETEETISIQLFSEIKDQVVGIRDNGENPIRIRLAALDIEIGCHKMITALKKREGK